MSTRGLLAFHVDGQTKATYNHSDSYPGGLGLTALEFCRQFAGEHGDILRSEVRELKPIAAPHTAPTAEEWEKFSQFASTAVGRSGERSWYQLLRQTQGQPGKILAAGYFEDAFDFGTDSLFCEWAFVVDLDAGNLDAYGGFNTAVEPVGLWADKPGRDEYKPITRVASFPLADLPSGQDFLRIDAKDNG